MSEDGKVIPTLNAGCQMIIILFYSKSYDGVVPYDTLSRKWRTFLLLLD